MKPLIYFAAFLIGFHFLFWHETFGINLFLFGFGILSYSFFNRNIRKLNLSNFILLSLALLSGLAVIFLNTAFSKIMFITAVLSSHLSLQMEANSVFEFLANSILNFFNFKSGLIPGLKLKDYAPRTRGVIILRVISLPLIIVFLYVILFSAGNSIFGDISFSFFSHFSDFIGRLFSPSYSLFILLGIIIIRWSIRKKWFKVFNLSKSNELVRKSKKRPKLHFHPMGLKYEFFMVITLLIALNGLFLIVNIIDVKWVWFHFNIDQVYNLKEFVHEGVGWLILSLLISIGIILFYFRGNLNFYPKNKFLKSLAYLWILQNAILSISVMLRTLHYVEYHGIASKRIGVFIFLLIVFFGLGSLFYKILKAQNFAFILKANSAFILIILTISSLVPWNVVTAKINLNHAVAHQIHVDNYLSLDPQIYPLLYANLDKIENQINQHQSNSVKWIKYATIEQFKYDLDLKSQAYLRSKSKLTFASWSMADQNAIHHLKQQLGEP